jgi:uncharacterized protein (TIGR02118 family)
MIKVSVLYPSDSGESFDMDYYKTKHMPMVQRLCGSACKGIAAESGISSGAPGTTAPFIAVGHLLFDSVEEFGAAFNPHAAEIMGDIPNYTKVQPIIQISEITL